MLLRKETGKIIFLAIPLFLLACYLLASKPNTLQTMNHGPMPASTKKLLTILAILIAIICLQVAGLTR